MSAASTLTSTLTEYSKSIVSLLRHRTQCLSGCNDSRTLAQQLRSVLTPRCLLLGSILDVQLELLKRHVLLGFSYDGHYLISYKMNVSCFESNGFEHQYSLHWWKVDLGKRLVKVKSAPLFENCTINEDLVIQICQREDSDYIVVMGSANALKKGHDQVTCSLSILSAPTASEITEKSIHLKYQLLHPFPKFNPILSLQFSDYSSKNNTSSVHAHSNSSCFTVHQTFLANDQGLQPINSSSISPCQILPVEVYQKQEALVEVSPIIGKNKYDNSVDICQYSLDIEQWLVPALEEMLASMNITLISLIDYDLQLSEVHEIGNTVSISIKVNVETINEKKLPACRLGYSLILLCEWYVTDNRAVIVKYSEPIVLKLQELYKMTVMTEHYWSPSPFYYHVHVLSNKSVLATGKSLHILHHHSLPLCIIKTTP